MDEWRIGLSSWIIQDGNYDDFECDQLTRFAVEFYPYETQRSQSCQKEAQLIENSKYRVNVRVARICSECAVIDFGFLAYQRARPPEWIQTGMWIEAVVNLGIDPFFYFESLAHLSEMLPMIYTWSIKKIEVETAPFIESIDEGGRVLRRRDESKSAFREIPRTNAWDDDSGNAEYVLHCLMMNEKPTQSRR